MRRKRKTKLTRKPKCPRLKLVVPTVGFPHVTINWTEKELNHLAKLLTSEPAEPTEALIRAMKS